MSAHPALGVITINLDPVVHLGPVQVHWYGIMYAIAFFTAYVYGVLPHVRARGVSAALAERMVTTIIITGLIGARLYFVVQQPDLVDGFLRHPLRIIAVWEGGMAFFGAIIASVLTILYLARRHHFNFWMGFDAGALFAVVGQPIGRIGNVINGDILGARSDAWFATAYTYHAPNSTTCAVLQPGFQCGLGYQPAAVYEALGTIAIGVVLFALRRRGVRDGVLALTYIAGYAISQFLIFFLRQSEPAIGLGLKQAQWTALVMFFVVLPLLILAWRRWPGKPSEVSEEGGSDPAAA